MNQQVKRAAANNPRLAAIRTLRKVLEQQQPLDQALARQQFTDPRDKALCQHLAYGVLRHYGSLQWLVGQLLRKPLKQRDQDLQFLVMLGLHQLWLDRTPEHAAVHACVQQTAALGKPWARGLINALLRHFQRRRDTLLDQLEQQPERLDHPAWLLDALRADWPDQWSAIVNANHRPAPMILRVNKRQTERAEYLNELHQAGIQAQPHTLTPFAIQLHQAVEVERLPGFASGRVSVQDAAAQLATDLLDLQPGQRVLDACAAPGGKTCHILEQQAELEGLVAVDNQPARVAKIEANLHRLGLQATVVTADAGEPERWWDKRGFERILLDAPCSATGVIRRHPDIKWLRQPEQVETVCRSQQQLLDKLWPLLKPGGMLLYVTCSILRTENVEQIERFVTSHADAVSRPLPETWGVGCKHGRQLLPGPDDCDGFFFAALEKSRVKPASE